MIALARQIVIKKFFVWKFQNRLIYITINNNIFVVHSTADGE